MCDKLADTFEKAYAQAMKGKGQERHGNGLPFLHQPIFTIQDLLGESAKGFPLGQAVKKISEACKMHDASRKDEVSAEESRNLVERARAELLGAMVYIAAAHIAMGREIGEEDED